MKIDWNVVCHRINGLLISVMFVPIIIGFPIFIVRDLLHGEPWWIVVLMIFPILYVYAWVIIAWPWFTYGRVMKS